MEIKIIFLGKNKEHWLGEGINAFLSKLKPFAKFKVLYLKDERILKSNENTKIKTKEGERIMQNIGSDEFLILLDEKGKRLTSIKFASFLETHLKHSQKLTFVVGGALGLSEEIKQKANMLLSFSDLTFTHQMIRLFLLEQIYRGFQIINKTGYHKE